MALAAEAGWRLCYYFFGTLSSQPPQQQCLMRQCLLRRTGPVSLRGVCWVFNSRRSPPRERRKSGPYLFYFTSQDMLLECYDRCTHTHTHTRGICDPEAGLLSLSTALPPLTLTLTGWARLTKPF